MNHKTERAITEIWWKINEEISEIQGYSYPNFVWRLGFKPENEYLTNEGYPLGTTCWYIYFKAAGEKRFCCKDTPIEAVIFGVDSLILQLDDMIKSDSNEPINNLLSLKQTISLIIK
ncbi:MAG: hypothetical protein PUP93_31090, partial [Rhizonema sp. NSF051]|nr:hypothetical protein [Rhizonema sp. NSF051]